METLPNMKGYLFTSESVTEGHPDKVSDQISDGILDEIIGKDPNARVACETLVTTGLAFISAEIRTDSYVEIPDVVRRVIAEIGYTDAAFGFDANTCAVMTSIDNQSADIAMGVDGDNTGAGDQGLMFGYASDETPELMPVPILLAHRICRRLAEARKSGEVPWLRPDGKSQVTVEYDAKGAPVRVHTVVVSTQHAPEVTTDEIKRRVKKEIIDPCLPPELVKGEIITHINPTGRFVEGGPKADTGLTGRKIIVDTYGGHGSHGGGAFSGKDPTKVDRSASYACRHVAKNLVAAGLCKRVEVQVAYAIGIPEPVSIMIDSFGTGVVSDEHLEGLVREHFNLTPRSIIKDLDLWRPIYRRTAAYGHFGREEDGFTWEVTSKKDDLQKAAASLPRR
jgi:S-adenosylmethionine synthetase